MRIATASVRTGLAMTGFCMECGAGPTRADRGVRPYGRVTRNLVERGVGDAAPYEWDGGTDCHSQCAHWPRNDTVFARSAMGGRPQGSPLRKRCKERGGAGDRKGRPYGSVTWSAWRRADVGSELSAASGRGSEVSEWPRSKLGASAVRQRRNFGHRNRVIVPYGAQRAYYFDF